MNANANLKMFPNLRAAMHAKTAFALAYTVAVQADLLVQCMEDPEQQVTIRISEFADILASVTTLASIALKHDLLDMGALETVWAEYLTEKGVRNLSRRVTTIVEATSAELEGVTQ